MHIIGQGILLGLWLSILVGPILFMFLQIGVERGFRAGLALASGVWISDSMYIMIVFFGINYIIQLTQWKSFELWLGSIGGVVLVAIGSAMLKGKNTIPKEKIEINQSSSYFSLIAQGFAINTLNPFPIFFWSSVMTGFTSKGGSTQNAFILLASILGTIIITDTLKVLLAKKLQRVLTYQKIFMMRKIAAYVIILFGVVLIIRVWVF